MRCPICSSPLAEGATTCPQCGCGVLPPPAAGTEPSPFVRKETTPRWPLVLSVLGVVAALVVIAVALYPLVDDGDDVATVAGSDPTTTVAGATTAVAVASSPVATTGAPVTTAADATSTAAPVTSTATTTAAPSTTGARATTTVAATSTVASTTTVGSTTTTAVTFPDVVAVALVEATCTAPDSTDSRGNPVTFNPLLTIDGAPDTAWRCEGASINEALVFTLVEPSDLEIVGALPGYAGADPFNGTDRFDQNRRVQLARWACLGADGSPVASVQQRFTDERDLQYVTVEGFVGCEQVLFEILESSRSGGRDYTAVSEVELLGTAA